MSICTNLKITYFLLGGKSFLLLDGVAILESNYVYVNITITIINTTFTIPRVNIAKMGKKATLAFARWWCYTIV